MTARSREGSKRRIRRGMSMVYAAVAMIAILMVISLTVDMGRAQLAKTELRRAVDAAARYGAAGLSSGVATVQTRVVDAANDNKVDGQTLNIDVNTELEFGTWNPGQYELSCEVASSDRRVLMLDAPTGVGKSLAGIAVGRDAGCGSVAVQPFSCSFAYPSKPVLTRKMP